MNYAGQDDHEVLEGLRALAADSPHEAPRRVEEQLLAAFRSRRRRRSLMTWAPAGLVAAGLVATGLWLSRPPRQIAPPGVVITGAAVAAAEEEADASFYPLPEAEGLPIVESAMVVRVQLPVSSLRLMGVPVSEDADSSVQAELLLGQDGLARAVRLVE
jgi:hypothetical protein